MLRKSFLALCLLGSLAACNEAAPVTNDAVITHVTPTPVVTTAAPTHRPVVTSPKPTRTPTKKPVRYDVKAVQRLLTTELFYIGEIDGKPGVAYVHAIAAFQKVNGLYGDGVVGKKTLAALKHPAATPKLKRTLPGIRVEVDLTKQLLYVVKDNVITRILPVSSGGGYSYPTKSGGRAHAVSPVGEFAIQRRIEGVRVSDLGTLYDPQYFYRGFAIHGEGYVPGYPASHGCIRVPLADGTWLLGQIGVGTHVSLYGGKHVFPAHSFAPVKKA